jgi:hypothetical protein
MDLLFRPIPLILALAAIVASALVNPALALLAAVVWTGLLLAASASRMRKVRASDPAEDLRPESRTLLRPVRKLAEDLRTLVDRHPEASSIRVLGKEAIEEADRIVAQTARNLEMRERLRASLAGRHEAERDVQALGRKAEESDSPQEKLSLLSALEARRFELEQYGKVEEGIRRIDSSIRQAEAALAELKARLGAASGAEAVQLRPEDDLRESLARVKSLSVSVEETETLLTEFGSD